MKTKKHKVSISKDFPAPVATFAGVPRIERGSSEDLELTPEQAWSLSHKGGVTVQGAPTADPRPWDDRGHHPDEIHAAIKAARRKRDGLARREPERAEREYKAAIAKIRAEHEPEPAPAGKEG